MVLGVSTGARASAIEVGDRCLSFLDACRTAYPSPLSAQDCFFGAHAIDGNVITVHR
jgi:hypothetical protein